MKSNILTYLVGTSGELLGDLESRISPTVEEMNKLREERRWAAYLAKLRWSFKPEVEKYQQEDTSYYGITLGYVITSAILTTISPIATPLLVDSAWRLYRQTFVDSNPVGIIGTAREGYKKLKNN